MTAPIRLTEFTAIDLIEAYRRKLLSPVEVARACLAKIDALDPTFNAFCLRDDETTLAVAKASEVRWQNGEPAVWSMASQQPAASLPPCPSRCGPQPGPENWLYNFSF